MNKESNMKMRMCATLALWSTVAWSGAAAAASLDLTGHWQGKWVCTGFDGTKFAENNAASTMAITQVGDALYVDMDGGAFQYNGKAITDLLRPTLAGSAALIECDTDNQPASGAEGEMIRATVKLNAAGSVAVFKATSIIEGPDATPFVGSCKYIYRRVDQTNPNLTACP